MSIKIIGQCPPEAKIFWSSDDKIKLKIYTSAADTYICRFITPFTHETHYLEIQATEKHLMDRLEPPLGFRPDETLTFSEHVLDLCNNIVDQLDMSDDLLFLLGVEHITMPFLSNSILMHFTKDRIFKRELTHDEKVLYALAQMLYIGFEAAQTSMITSIKNDM